MRQTMIESGKRWDKSLQERAHPLGACRGGSPTGTANRGQGITCVGICKHKRIFKAHSKVTNGRWEWQIRGAVRMKWHRRCRGGGEAPSIPVCRWSIRTRGGLVKGNPGDVAGHETPSARCWTLFLGRFIWQGCACLCVGAQEEEDMGIFEWSCMWIKLWARCERSSCVYCLCECI